VFLAPVPPPNLAIAGKSVFNGTAGPLSPCALPHLLAQMMSAGPVFKPWGKPQKCRQPRGH
jgi:hypothetical protein